MVEGNSNSKSKQSFKHLVKLLLYTTCLVFFFKFYFNESISEFMKGSSSFTSRFERRLNLDLPSIVVCVNPPYNKSAVTRIGYKSLRSIVRDSSEKYKKRGLNPWQVFKAITFGLGKGIDIMMKDTLLKEGTNIIGGELFIVKPIATFYYGMCYMIEPQKVTKSILTPLLLSIKVNSGIDQIRMFLTSPNSWYGIIESSWAHFDPTEFGVKFDPGSYVQADLSITELKLRKGTKSVSQCLADVVDSMNCSTKCFPLIFNDIVDIPPCKNYKQFYCIIREDLESQETSSKIRHCLRPEQTQLYKANYYTAPNEYVDNPSFMDFWIRFISDEVEIKEEMPVISVETFIGSVGGSLGLFLGFSFYSAVSSLIDMMFNAL